MDEELVELQEQLASARAEVEALQGGMADAEARAQTAADEARQLYEEVRSAREAVAAATSEADTLRAQLAESDERAKATAGRYRELALRTEPAVPAELISGETVDEIDASLEAARSMVGRVRTHLEEQAQARRVPVGAPQRAAPDVSALTPEQKIRYGLEQRAT